MYAYICVLHNFFWFINIVNTYVQVGPDPEGMYFFFGGGEGAVPQGPSMRPVGSRSRARWGSRGIVPEIS